MVFYQFGPWIFDYSRCLLVSEGIEKELDPLSFKLLSYFIKQDKRIVAREELIEQVWQRNFVDDNAINRAISELRKQLQHTDSKAPLIKTHYRKGYSLSAEIIHLTELENNDSLLLEKNHEISTTALLVTPAKAKFGATNKKIVTTLFTQKISLLITLLIVFSVVAIFALMDSNKNQDYLHHYVDKTNVSSATWNLGTEYHPLVSFDRQYFSYGNVINNTHTTFVKHIADQHQIELDYQNMQIMPLSWQPKKQALLTILKNDLNNECQYALFDLHGFPNVIKPTLIKACDISAPISAQLSPDGKTLYDIQSIDGHAGAIYQYDLQSKKQNLLLPSMPNGTGAQEIKLSANGQFLAYVWSNKSGSAQVYVLNLPTNENTLLHQFKPNTHAQPFDWSTQNNHIMVAEDNSLYHINIHTKHTTVTEFLHDYDGVDDLTVEHEKQILIVPKPKEHLELLQISNLFTDEIPIFRPIYRAEQQSYAPIITGMKSSALSFASNRAGNHQIWQFNQGALKQVSFLPTTHGKINNPKLSTTGKQLLFIDNNKLKLVDLARKEFITLSEFPVEIDSYAWPDINTIIYAKAIGSHHQIWKLDRLTKEHSLLSPSGGHSLIEDASGNVYYFNNNSIFDMNNKEVLSLPFQVFKHTLAAVTEKYLYVFSSRTLYRIELTTGLTTQLKLSFSIESLAVYPDDNKIIVTKEKSIPGQIKRVTW